jgi:hypothetical protein
MSAQSSGYPDRLPTSYPLAVQNAWAMTVFFQTFTNSPFMITFPSYSTLYYVSRKKSIM